MYGGEEDTFGDCAEMTALNVGVVASSHFQGVLTLSISEFQGVRCLSNVPPKSSLNCMPPCLNVLCFTRVFSQGLLGPEAQSLCWFLCSYSTPHLLHKQEWRCLLRLQ